MISRCSLLPLLCLFALTVSGYRFGLLTDDSLRGTRFHALVKLAVEDVAATTPIELVYNNTRLKTSDALFATTWQLQHGRILGTIGPMTTQEMSPVAVSAASYNVPVFSSTSSSEYSDKILYPNVFRARSTDDQYAYALVQLVEALGAKYLGVVASADIYGNGLGNTLDTMKPRPGFQVLETRFSTSTDPNAAASILEAIKELKDQGVRVFCYHAAPANLVMLLTASAQLGMTDNPDYQIILNPDLAANLPQANGVKPELVKGMLAFPMALPEDTPKYKELAARAKAGWPTHFAQWGPNFNELLGYDAVIGYARSIEQLKVEGKDITPANIASTLAKLTYTGATGEIKFNAKLTRVYPHDIWNWQGSLQYVVVGHYDRQQPFEFNAAKVVWPGGATEPVWDGFSLRNNQDLPGKVTGALSALSFFVAMLSAWCCVVLIEQATYGVVRRMRVWHWCLLTGTLWGVCSIWGSSLVAFGSLDFPVMGHPPLQTTYAVVALIIAIATGISVFFLGIRGVKQLHLDAVKAARTSSYVPPTGGQQTEASVTASSQRQASITQISSAKHSSQILEDEENKKAKAQFTTLHRKINRWLVGAALAQVVGTTSVLVLLLITATPDWLEWQSGGGVPVGAIFVDALFAFIGLLFTFHFLPVTPIRSIGTLPLTFSVFVHGQILMGGTKWTYKLAGATADLSGYWNHEHVALAIAVVTVGLCMMLIAYNVMSMKLSRNSLDVHMAQFKKQFKQLTEQVDAYKALVMTKEKQREQLWRMLELISLGRPLGREHALAIALADFVQDPLQNGQLLPVTIPTADKDKEKEKDKEEEVSLEQSLNKPKREETSIMHTYEKIIKMQNSRHELRLEELVAHPVTCELLKDAMAKHHDVESLMLYMDIQQYKKIENAKVRTFMAREIYDCFLAKGAKYEVNVSDTLRRPFHQRFGFDKGQLSPAVETVVSTDFFADVEREMRNLLQTNGMARLQSSGMDQLCGQLLRMLKVPVKTTRGVSSKNADRFDRERESSPSPVRLSVFDNARSASPLVTVSQSSARGIAHVSHRPVFAPSPTVEGPPLSPPPEASIAWAPPV